MSNGRHKGPKCRDCYDTGLSNNLRESKWCHCPTGRAYEDEIARAREVLNQTIVPPAPSETVH